MLGLEWIGHLVETIGAIIPRFIHCKTTHKGVMFRFGEASIINPGIRIYIPLWSEPILYPIKRQTLNLPPQFFTTKNGEEARQTILVSIVVIYEVNDILKALIDTYEVEATIRDVAQGVVKKVIVNRCFGDLLANQTEIDEQIKEKVQEDLSKYGCKVLDAFITDFAKTRVYRMVGDIPEELET